MALVRISKQLIEDVEGCVNNLRNAEINFSSRPRTEIASFPGDGAALLAAEVLWGQHLHLQSQMPSAWVHEAERPRFHTLFHHEDGTPETTASVAFDGARVVVPPNTDLLAVRPCAKLFKVLAVDVKVPYGLIQEAAADRSHRFHHVAASVMHVVDFEKNARKVRKAWDARRAQIKLFLTKCKSLNEAIKLWPEVKLYVPQHYIATVETPVVRPQNVVRKERTLADVDTDGLTAAAVAARLQGLV